MSDALTVIFICYVVVTVVMPIIVATFLFPPRHHPRLDKAFIWSESSLSTIAAFFLLIRLGAVPRGSSTALYGSVALWINAAISELFVLYCIYIERFHDPCVAWLRSGRIRLCNFVSRSSQRLMLIVRGRD